MKQRTGPMVLKKGVEEIDSPVRVGRDGAGES
jgi:hypothetical protein